MFSLDSGITVIDLFFVVLTEAGNMTFPRVVSNLAKYFYPTLSKFVCFAPVSPPVSPWSTIFIWSVIVVDENEYITVPSAKEVSRTSDSASMGHFLQLHSPILSRLLHLPCSFVTSVNLNYALTYSTLHRGPSGWSIKILQLHLLAWILQDSFLD